LGLVAQEVHQIAGGEARRAALPDVGDLASGEKIFFGRDGEDLRAISTLLEHGLEDPLGAPVQAAEQDRDRVALATRERPRRVRAIGLSGGGRSHVPPLLACRSIHAPSSCTPSKPGKRLIVSSTLRTAACPSSPANRYFAMNSSSPRAPTPVPTGPQK